MVVILLVSSPYFWCTVSDHTMLWLVKPSYLCVTPPSPSPDCSGALRSRPSAVSRWLCLQSPTPYSSVSTCLVPAGHKAWQLLPKCFSGTIFQMRKVLGTMWNGVKLILHKYILTQKNVKQGWWFLPNILGSQVLEDTFQAGENLYIKLFLVYIFLIIYALHIPRAWKIEEFGESLVQHPVSFSNK